MVNRVEVVLRRLAPVCGAGVLLQATGCQINGSELAAGLASTILTNVITNWVFGVFSLGVAF